jgi:hypothetical protein
MADTDFFNQRAICSGEGAAMPKRLPRRGPTPSPGQLIAARALLGLSMDALAKAMQAGTQTIVRVETSAGLGRVNQSTIAAFIKFYQDNGIELIDDGERIGLMWRRTDEPER